MATDILLLGGISFDEWSTPERVPFGGKQAMAVHKLPGGARVVDTLGPDDADIQFAGTVYGNNAYGVADALDALRSTGTPVPLIFAGRFYTVIIQEFHADIERFPQLMRYHISCMIAQNNMAGILGAITSSVTSLVSADISTALSIVGL
jgi:hypothetical protein